MQTGTGISICEGIAVGRIRWCGRKNYDEDRSSLVRKPDEEWECFERARETVKRQQKDLGEKAGRVAGASYAGIFGIYTEILDDELLTEKVRDRIFKGRCSAQEAVRSTLNEIRARFRAMEDPCFQAREADILDIRNALLDALTQPEQPAADGAGQDKEGLRILAGEDFTPSETVRFDRSTMAGMVIREGSGYSHTAILARSMNLPTLIRCGELSPDWDGKLAVLDGYTGTLYVDPSEELLRAVREQAGQREKAQQALWKIRHLPAKTKSGKRISLGANASSLSDVRAAVRNGAEEIGLFRSEFLYLNAKQEPGEEEQFRIYRSVLEEFRGGRVVIRTCDIGADKSAGYLQLAPEENPALGLRGIRLCLKEKDFFKHQLRALLRASVYGNLEIMLPMITSAWEIRACRELIAECRKELEEEGKPVAGRIPLGIIVETPAAAMCAEELAKEADFFSIGTNDLAQYTCAADRQNQNVSSFFCARHPAVLKEIQMAAEAAGKQKIRVGICGELGADPDMTEQWIRMGIDELSVNPSAILPLRQKIRELD